MTGPVFVSVVHRGVASAGGVDKSRSAVAPLVDQRIGSPSWSSHPTIIKAERGDPTVAIGTVLEAATLLGVLLFDADPVLRVRLLDRLTVELALLAKSGRRAAAEADDDF